MSIYRHRLEFYKVCTLVLALLLIAAIAIALGRNADAVSSEREAREFRDDAALVAKDLYGERSKAHALKEHNEYLTDKLSEGDSLLAEAQRVLNQCSDYVDTSGS